MSDQRSPLVSDQARLLAPHRGPPSCARPGGSRGGSTRCELRTRTACASASSKCHRNTHCAATPAADDRLPPATALLPRSFGPRAVPGPPSPLPRNGATSARACSAARRSCAASTGQSRLRAGRPPRPRGPARRAAPQRLGRRGRSGAPRLELACRARSPTSAALTARLWSRTRLPTRCWRLHEPNICRHDLHSLGRRDREGLVLLGVGNPGVHEEVAGQRSLSTRHDVGILLCSMRRAGGYAVRITDAFDSRGSRPDS